MVKIDADRTVRPPEVGDEKLVESMLLLSESESCTVAAVAAATESDMELELEW